MAVQEKRQDDLDSELDRLREALKFAQHASAAAAARTPEPSGSDHKVEEL